MAYTPETLKKARAGLITLMVTVESYKPESVEEARLVSTACGLFREASLLASQDHNKITVADCIRIEVLLEVASKILPAKVLNMKPV